MRITNQTIETLSQEEKIRSFDDMCDIVRRLKKSGRQVILAQGVFDIVHAGHVGYVRAATQVSAKGGILIVGIESDASVAQNKGVKRPINPAEDRMIVLSEFTSIKLTFTYPGVPNYNDPYDYLERYRALRPDAIVVPTFDPHLELKRWQAAQSGTTIAPVSYQHLNPTTKVLQSLGYEE